MPKISFGDAVLAPMAGVTGYPFRKIALKWGAGFCFTEMISAAGFLRDDKATMELVFAGADMDRTGMQLFGSSPDELSLAAEKAVALGFRAIDVNMGCPVKKVVKTGAGSAVLKDLKAFSLIVEKVRRAVNDRTFTIKIRSGFDENSVNFMETGKIAESSGVDAIFFHPRTRAQMFGGAADHSLTRRLKEGLSIPVYASGDIFTVSDALRIKAGTGANGVMFARGAIGRPWIFAELFDEYSSALNPACYGMEAAGRAEIGVKYKTAALLELMEEMNLFYGKGRGHNLVKPHLYNFFKGFRGSKKLRCMLNTAKTEEDINDILRIVNEEAE